MNEEIAMETIALGFDPKPEFVRHGGAYDRGSADAWYGREYDPHFFRGDTYSSERVTALTAEELRAYNAGYNNTPFAQKQWD
jgi:hypothetical protein